MKQNLKFFYYILFILALRKQYLGELQAMIVPRLNNAYILLYCSNVLYASNIYIFISFLLFIRISPLAFEIPLICKLHNHVTNSLFRSIPIFKHNKKFPLFMRKKIFKCHPKFQIQQLTLLNLVGVPRLWGGYAFLYRMKKEPPCMPALTRWITRQDVVVIFLREALRNK